jgi:ABC-type iron transport system FetAB ATPase subunit
MNASPAKGPSGPDGADASHAERRILRRTVEMYDQRRAWFPQELESVSRELAVDWLSRTARIDDIRAAELIADRLASRATKRLGE